MSAHFNRDGDSKFEQSPVAGRQDPEEDFKLSLGVAEKFAVIHKTPDADDNVLGWSSEFPVGYSSGLGVPSGTTFDSITPFSCDDINMRIGDVDTFQAINWT